MHLIASLIAGIRGAENGTVRIFKRATSTRATFYADFIGTIHSLSGYDVTLDANGSTTIYVNELVDVTVLDSNGTQVRSFVEGASSPNVEVVSDSFTGVNYTSSASAAGNPTNLQTVLDRWLNSAGTTGIDWKVNVDGVGTDLEDAIGSIAGVFFNVKSPAYGAKGDGATDDTTAIQNTLNAASAAGGGIVLFPDGTYIVSAKLTVAATVSLWGTSPSVSIISMNHATADLLEYGAGISLVPQEIRGLMLTVAVANTGKLVSILDTGTRIVHIKQSIIGDTGGLHTGDVINMEAGILLLADSGVYLRTSGGIEADDVLARVELRNTFLSVTGTGAYDGSIVKLKSGVIEACRFSFGAVTSGSHVAINIDGTGSVADVQIIGNRFTPGSGGTSGCIQGTNINFAAASIIEVGSNIEAGFTAPWAGLATQSNNPKIQLFTRESLIRTAVSNASPLALQGDLYGVVIVERTAAGGAQSLTSAVGPPGSFLTVFIYNNTVGALSADPTFDTGFYPAGASITKPSAGKYSVAHFRSIFTAGGGSWMPLAAFKTDF